MGAYKHGSFNVVFPITFCDGLKWIIKVFVNGTPARWDSFSESTLLCEARTMRALGRDTTIPMPEVISFCASTNGPIGSPYIVMTFIEGLSAHAVWHGDHFRDRDAASVHAARLRILEGVAKASVQLGRYTFDQSGGPHFVDDVSTVHMVPLRRLNHRVMSMEMRNLEGRVEVDHVPKWLTVPVIDNGDTQACYRPATPDPAMAVSKHDHEFDVGISLLLQELVRWIPEPPMPHPFVLTHPDLDLQNILVTKESELKGILDWDSVFAGPHSSGNEAYPKWLMRDWDLAIYGDIPTDEDDIPFDSLPREMALYRRLYDDIIARERSEAREACDDLTRVSLVASKMRLAMEDETCRENLLGFLLNQMWTAAGKEGEVDLGDVVISFFDGDVDEELMATLRYGFHRVTCPSDAEDQR